MKRKDHVRVGLFVLGSLALFVVLVVFAIGSRLGKREVSYFIHFSETVKGMVAGSPVNFQGVRIGRVEDMRFVSGRTEVQIAIDPVKAPIQKTTVASLDRAWVTGQVTIELQGWTELGDALPEYGLIAAELSPGAKVLQSMPEVVARATEIIGEFSSVARRLEGIFADDAPLMREVLGLLRDGRETSAHLRESTLPQVDRVLATWTELEPELRNVLGRVGRAATSVESLASDPEAQRAIAEAADFVARASDALPDLVRLGREVETFVRGNRSELRAALASFASGLRDFQEFARVLQHAPNSLLFGYRRADTQVPSPASPPLAVPEK